MKTQLSEPLSVTQRLEEVERENRLFKRFGVVVLCLVAASVLMGQAKSERTVEADRFVLRDPAGRLRAEISMDQSGTPAITFYDEHGSMGSHYRDGDLMILGKEYTVMNGGFTARDYTLMNSRGVTVEKKEGRLDVGIEGLQFKTTSYADPAHEYASLGIGASLRHDGIVGPELTLFGGKQGFARLDAADGPRLHLEPGMWEGKLLPGGFVDITSEGPLMQVSDQQGVTAAIGRYELKEKDSGRNVWTPTASVVLLDKDKVRWSAPN